MPKEETKTWKAKHERIQRVKEKREQARKGREVVRQAQKLATEELAEQAFGEGGLTPARKQALEQVLLGPEGGELSINNPQKLRVYIRKAREKFLSLADRYVDVHFKSVNGAYTSGEYETAARHAEWAMENLGDGVERIVEPPPKTQPQSATPPIMVGVNLGGVLREK